MTLCVETGHTSLKRGKNDYEQPVFHDLLLQLVLLPKRGCANIRHYFISNKACQFARKPAVKHFVCDVLRHVSVMEGGRMRRMRTHDALPVAAADWMELSRREGC